MTVKLPKVVARRPFKVAAGLIALVGWQALATAQTHRGSSLAADEDYLFLCRTDAQVHRCVEVLRSTDLRSRLTTAQFNYYELDTAGLDSRTLSCAVDPSVLTIETSGPRLRRAVLQVAVSPESERCLGSWGGWAAGSVGFDVTLTPSGDFARQSRGHGIVQFPEAGFRFAEALESWSVQAAGTVSEHAFDGAKGNLQTIRRSDIEKLR